MRSRAIPSVGLGWARPSAMGLARSLVAVSLAGCMHAAPKARTGAESRAVVWTFDESGFFVRAMTVGEETILPPACAPPRTGAATVLCNPAFRALAHGQGTMSAHVVDMRREGRGATYVFAAVIAGSGECGAYGFWAIRVGQDVRVTPPIEGCFMLQGEATADTGPTIQWGPPLSLALRAASKPVETFVLDEGAYSFAPRGEP